MPNFVPSGSNNPPRREKGEAIDLSLKVSLPEVEHVENQESACAADRDCRKLLARISMQGDEICSTYQLSY